MNKFIILSILIYSTYCSYTSCVAGTNDKSECKNHKIEFNGFSCYKSDYSYFGEGAEGLHCTPFPNDSKVQKNIDHLFLDIIKK